MTRTPSVMLWSPRIAGLALSVFLAAFALDAFDGRSFVAALPGFALHLLPAALVLAIVAVSWRLPLAGAVTFPLLAVGYAFLARGHLDWVAVIGGPLVVLGVLFLLSWRAHERRQ